MISLWVHKTNVLDVPFRFHSSKLLHLLFQTFIRIQALITNAQLSDRQLKCPKNEKMIWLANFCTKLLHCYHQCLSCAEMQDRVIVSPVCRINKSRKHIMNAN